MIPMFSGIASRKEYELLEEAGVTHCLADQFDLANVPEGRPNLTLDCGAYKLSKKGRTVEVKPYIKVADSRDFFLRMAPDVLGDPDATRRNWKAVRRCGVPFVPVYQWGAPRDHLLYYLDEAPIVAVGGLVSIMHEKETKEQQKARERMLKELAGICAEFSQRIHVLGCSWLKAADRIKEHAFSYDSAKWISSAGKGRIIFPNVSKARPFLALAPQKVIKENGASIYADLDREGRAILNARNIEEYFLGGRREVKAA